MHRDKSTTLRECLPITDIEYYPNFDSLNKKKILNTDIMACLNALNPEEATGKAKELLDVAKSKMGVVPNMMKTMANAPAVLNAYPGFSTALKGV